MNFVPALWRCRPLLLRILIFAGFFPTAGMAVGTGTNVIPNPFFAMDTGTRDGTHTSIDSQVQMIKELGYDGFAPIYKNPEELKATFAALDKAGLQMFALYAGINIDAGKAALTPQMKEAIELLKGRNTFLWLYVQSSKFKPSATEGDASAKMALDEVARFAESAHVRIALYPHTGFWIQQVEDAVRIAGKVKPQNVGVTFNLAHWLMTDGHDLNASLRLARPYLYLVTINGADATIKDWHHVIQPLDKGSFDVVTVLSELKTLGYVGPVGLQLYGVGGNAEQNLKNSMDAWRRASARAIATDSLNGTNSK